MTITTLGNGTFPAVIPPMSNVTPFTYRDGITFQELLYALRDYMTNTLSPEFALAINDTIQSINDGLAGVEQSMITTEAQWQSAYDTFAAQINTKTDGWQATYDTFTAGVQSDINSISNRVGPVNLQRITLAPVRTNYSANPEATGTGAGFATYVAGTGETGNTTFVTGAVDGPLTGLSTYARRTVTAPKTAGSTGWANSTGAERAQHLGNAGDVITTSVYVRYTGPGTTNITTETVLYDGTGVKLTTVVGSTVTLQSGVWARLSATATATTPYASIGWWAFQTSGFTIPAGAILDATAALVEVSPTLGSYFKTTAPGTILTPDPLWPDAHPVDIQVFQNSNGNATLGLAPSITGTPDILSAANSLSEFRLMPNGDGTWHISTRYVPKTGSVDVYVNPGTGVDTNTGLTSTTALKTVAEAVRRAQLSAMTADAVYTIHLAGATYTERVVLAKLTAFMANIVIKGPDVGGHPNVPTAVWNEGVGTSASAFISQNPNLTMTFQDIKFLNYNGSASSQALNFSAGNLYTINVHVQNCFYGVSSIKGNLDIKGGLFDNNGRLQDGSGTGAAVRSLMLNQHTLGTQNAGTTALGPVFTNNRYGVLAQENSTGHLDYCTFTDNESAVVLRINSRGNIDGTSFARNATDVLADGNSDVYISDAVVFATGADKSQQRVNALSGSQVTTSSRVVSGVEMARSRSSYVVAGNYADQVFTGTTTDHVAMTQTLKAQWFDNTLRTIGDACQKVKVRMTGNIAGTAGTKKVGVTFGGVSSDIFWGTADTGTFIYECEVMFTSPAHQILASKASLHLSTVNRNTVTKLTADTTQDIIVKAHVLNSDATDTVTIYSVEFEVS